MSEFVGEFLGTFLLLLIGGGVVASVILKGGKAEDSGWNTIVLAWGLAVTFAIYAVGSISGAHINPAVTVGLAFVGTFPWEKVPVYILAQVLGAFFGAVLVWVFYIPHWSMTADKGVKLGVFSTIPSVRSTIHNFMSEMIATAFLLFGLMFIGTNNFTDGLNPLVVGALIMLIGFGLGGTTGFAINPARDFGPRFAHYILPVSGKGDSDWRYSWIPIVAPFLGGILGVSLYQVLYKSDYQLKYWIVIAIAVTIVIMAAMKRK